MFCSGIEMERVVHSCSRVLQEVHWRDSKSPLKFLGVFTSVLKWLMSTLVKGCSGVAQKYFEVAQGCSGLGWSRVNSTEVVKKYQKVI